MSGSERKDAEEDGADTELKTKTRHVNVGKNGTGDRQEAFTCEKPMFCAVWKKISSMHIDVSTTEFVDQKM